MHKVNTQNIKELPNHFIIHVDFEHFIMHDSSYAFHHHH
jgi:hypothetical protein